MGLPTLSIPTHTLTVPSTKKKLKYRPFLVKEEKIMLLVKESKDADEIMQAMKDIVNSCTYGKLDIDNLAVFDIEYIFLQLRSKSIGEIIEIPMKCLNETEGEDGEKIECGETIDFNIDVSKIKVKFPKEHSKSIILDEDKGIGVTFRYPGLDEVVTLEEDDDFVVVAKLVDNIFDTDNVYDAKDIKIEEISEFIDTLSSAQYKIIMEKFFGSIPTVTHTANYECPKCGKKGSYTFSGIKDFF